MKIIKIVESEFIRKTDEELEAEHTGRMGGFVSSFKEIPLDKPKYLIEVSVDELQLINFYSELDKRNPIIKVKLKKWN